MAATSDATRQPVLRPAPATPSDAAEWPGLGTAAEWAGMPLDDIQLARFDAYRRLLLDWNARFNLTAIADPVEVERRLFFDALLMVPALDTLLAGRDAGPRLVDVGSGAGFPGLVLNIARPCLDVALIEATGKKVTFLSHVIAELGLAGAVAHHGRA